jgi:hypothetical protein
LQRHEGDEYFFSERIGGSKHFGLWPWPIPQLAIEFEVADAESVRSGAAELTVAGYALLHDSKTEPWGQTIARLQTPEGAIVGVCFTPWLH